MYEIYGLTSVGRVREHNEDCFLINGVVYNAGDAQALVNGDFIAAVADGVGGQNAGDVASRIALSEMASFVTQLLPDQLTEAIQEINRKIYDYGQTHTEARGLATTLAGVISMNGVFTLFHVGDSRVYRFTNNFLRLMTHDHSLVQLLFDSEEITREQIFNHPQNHILTQSLGNIDKPVQVDISTMNVSLPIDDIMLICSDGLSDLIQDDDMENILNNGGPLPEIIQKLVDTANNNGGRDNITCVGIRRQTEE